MPHGLPQQEISNAFADDDVATGTNQASVAGRSRAAIPSQAKAYKRSSARGAGDELKVGDGANR